MKIRIMVATHKPFQMPTNSIYLPIHVGKALNPDVDLGLIGDNTGENISLQNANLNELTAIYWAWKNLDADYIGLTHYRRHFSLKKKRDKFSSILSSDEAKKLCESSDIIVTNKRKYYIETIKSHFLHFPYANAGDLVCVREVIGERQPKYLEAFDKVMNRRWAHMFNMFIMKKPLFDEYCQFLFDVILETEKRIDMSGRKPIEARMYVSEFLLDTWLTTNGYAYKEIPFVFMENEKMLKKGIVLILRKLGFSGKKRLI